MVHDYLTLAHAVEEFGLAVSPEWLVQSWVKKGRLRTAVLRGSGPDRQWWVRADEIAQKRDLIVAVDGGLSARRPNPATVHRAIS